MTDSSIERNSGAPYEFGGSKKAALPIAEPYASWFAQCAASGLSMRTAKGTLSAFRAAEHARACGWHLIQIGDKLILSSTGDLTIRC